MCLVELLCGLGTVESNLEHIPYAWFSLLAGPSFMAVEISTASSCKV